MKILTSDLISMVSGGECCDSTNYLGEPLRYALVVWYYGDYAGLLCEYRTIKVKSHMTIGEKDESCTLQGNWNDTAKNSRALLGECYTPPCCFVCT